MGQKPEQLDVEIRKPKTQNMGYGTKARTVKCRDPGNDITVRCRDPGNDITVVIKPK